MPRAILRYHEIALKGGNRSFFESCLKDQLKRVLPPKSGVRVRRQRDHFVVEFPDSVEREWIQARLAKVFGVAHYCFVEEVQGSGVEAVVEAVIPFLERVLAEHGGGSREVPFRVECRRREKDGAFTSMQLARGVAQQVLPRFPALKVNLENPELILYLDWFNDHVQWYAQKHAGLGGLPVGASGKLVSLLSSGFDSPVAALRMMRRGAKVTFAHFHSVPATSRDSIDNVRELVQQLTTYQGHAKLFLFPLLEFQKTVLAKAPAAFRTLLYRRMMMRVAERLARYDRSKGLVTGESLAQVASQTLDNLRTVNAVVHLPIYRPLIGMDKVEIVREATQFGTQAISARPAEDCCTLYVDRSPTLSSRPEQLEKLEADLPIEAMANAIWEGREVEVFEA